MILFVQSANLNLLETYLSCFGPTFSDMSYTYLLHSDAMFFSSCFHAVGMKIQIRKRTNFVFGVGPLASAPSGRISDLRKTNFSMCTHEFLQYFVGLQRKARSARVRADKLGFGRPPVGLGGVSWRVTVGAGERTSVVDVFVLFPFSAFHWCRLSSGRANKLASGQMVDGWVGSC